MTLLPGFFMLAFLSFANAFPQDTKSALESDPGGWVDIMPGADLNGWTVLTIPAGGSIHSPSQWKVEPAGTLVCDGTGGHEWLRYDRELKDFMFHVEWRFAPIEAGKGYNSGVYVRNSGDAKVWHQAQVGGGSGGFLFGDTPVGGEVKRVNLRASSVVDRVKPAGEWNTYEITCRGPVIKLWTNGLVTSEMPNCEALQGYAGLEAEGYRIEFRNLKLKELR
ncbi:MAG: DUF1080 domain-containing protein [Acidobacteria bacterium]|nr:MAG: DUF1080 domain-containing protein [Acidobacteriota bacterium]